MTPSFLLRDLPLDPLRAAPHRADAGLAWEKHRWLLRSALAHGRPAAPFDHAPPVLPVRDVLYDPDGVPTGSLPFATTVLDGEIPRPPLRVAVAAGPRGAAAEAARAFVVEWEGPLYLAFARTLLTFGDGTSGTTDPVVRGILGRDPWPEERDGWVALDDAGVRARAFAVLGPAAAHRFYLVAGDPGPELRAVVAGRRGAAAADPARVEFRAFHALVSACGWVATSHRGVPGAAPTCLYAREGVGERLARYPGVEVVESAVELNRRAGVSLPARGGVPWREAAGPLAPGAARVSVAWTAADRLDGIGAPASVREVALDATGIDDLAPLAELPALESLSLRGVQPRTLGPLSALPALRRIAADALAPAELAALAAVDGLEALDLTGQALHDAALLGRPGVREMVLDHTGLERVDALAALPRLERLSIRHTPVRDLSPLREAAALRALDAGGCHGLDLATLAGLRLERLALAGEDGRPLEVPDPDVLARVGGLAALSILHTALAGLPAALGGTLRELDLSASAVSGTEWLRAFPALRALDLSASPARGFAAVGALAGLRELRLGLCHVDDLSWLAGLAELRVLGLHATGVTDLSPVAALPGLHDVAVGAVPATVFPRPASLASLRSLAVQGWALAGLPWLPEAAGLESLSLAGTDAAEVAWMAGWTALASLDLGGTGVRSLAGLESAPLRVLRAPESALESLSGVRVEALEELWIRRTRVRDLAPLAGCRTLRRLDVRGVDLTEAAWRVIAELPRLDVLLADVPGPPGIATAVTRRHRLLLPAS